MKYVATISGGKDSVTMCDLLLKNDYPVDYIVFNDTLDEFEEMYIYIDKVAKYFKERYGKEIITTKPNWTYDKYILGERTRGEREGIVRGLPNGSDSFCTWRREAKINPTEKWLNSLKIKEYKLYIGFTLDESNRANREDDKFIYPLIDYFNMTEINCKEYLIKQDMENTLYRHFNRTGCRKCQYQSDKDFFIIWKHYPKVWKEFKDYEEKVSQTNCIDGKYWFTKNRSCEDMEKLFKQKDKQGSLFDFSDEPLKDCFCKI